MSLRARCRASMRPSPASSTGAGRPPTWSGCSRSWTTRRSAAATRSPAGTRRRTARSAPRSSRRTSAARGIGIAVLDALEGWAGDHHATELEGPVSEDDEGSLIWAANHGYTRGRTQLAARARPDRRRRARAEPAGGDRDRHVGGAARARGRHVRGRPRGRPGHPGRRRCRHRHARGVAAPRHAGRQRRPERGLRRARERRGRRLREALPDKERTDRAYHDLTGVKRAHRGRGIAAALKRDADRVGEIPRLHVAADLERGAERADPAPERAPRLRPRAGRRDRARHWDDRRYCG